MKVISVSQYKRGDTAKAEKTMRTAIIMIEREWGSQHPWILEFKNVLEGWLRDRGEKGAADVLREQIKMSMWRDEPKDVL